LAQYKQPTVHELAAAYAHALIRNHPFVDGNKRIGLLAARVFLFRNGYRLNPDEAQTVTVIRRVAAGDIDQAELARWLEENSRTVE
jgi:death-on-curing protein